MEKRWGFLHPSIRRLNESTAGTFHCDADITINADNTTCFRARLASAVDHLVYCGYS